MSILDAESSPALNSEAELQSRVETDGLTRALNVKPWISFAKAPSTLYIET